MESTSPARGWHAVDLRLLSIVLALALAGCGGAPRTAQSADDDEDEDEEDEEIDDDEEEEDEEDDEDGEGFVDSAMLRQANEPIELGDPVALVGTGVTMRAAELTPCCSDRACRCAIAPRSRSSSGRDPRASTRCARRRSEHARSRRTPRTSRWLVSGCRSRSPPARRRRARAWLLVHDGHAASR
jgi:hypothetical protein